VSHGDLFGVSRTDSRQGVSQRNLSGVQSPRMGGGDPNGPKVGTLGARGQGSGLENQGKGELS